MMSLKIIMVFTIGCPDLVQSPSRDQVRLSSYEKKLKNLLNSEILIKEDYLSPLSLCTMCVCVCVCVCVWVSE